ncbi:MAG: nucleotidyl transferase superfamily [Chitinophagaceae bacterium]|nr:nucleotidyl transferase superfamily [Chitinophagaceae bacterium]
MTSFNHAIIMAAGRGTRMMPLTTDIPKPMAPYNGSTLIANSITKVKNHIPHLHITVGYKKAMLAKHVIEEGVASVFNTEGQGNSWWIFNTLLKNLDEPLLVLTCDNIIELDLDLIAKEYNAFGGPACMVVPVKPVEGLHGDFIFHNKGVVSELNRNKPSDIYCSGIQVLNPKKINSLIQEVDDFYDVWKQLIAIQQLYCCNTYPEKWFTVDTMDQLHEANKINKEE